MAVDEALLASAATSGIATLRFYAWSEPTLSLGYFQAADDRAQHPASCDCPLVRRSSGGGAILHDRELTYSVALPQRDIRSSASGELVTLFHQALAEALAAFGIAAELFDRNAARSQEALDPGSLIGRLQTCPTNVEPFLCFQRRSCGDLLRGQEKIAGSAQRRRRGAVLQHGSVLLERSPYAPELPGIVEFAGQPLSASELTDVWLSSLIQRLAASTSTDKMTSAEQDLALVLEQDRFQSAAFTLRR